MAEQAAKAKALADRAQKDRIFTAQRDKLLGEIASYKKPSQKGIEGWSNVQTIDPQQGGDEAGKTLQGAKKQRREDITDQEREAQRVKEREEQLGREEHRDKERKRSQERDSGERPGNRDSLTNPRVFITHDLWVR